MIPIQILIGLFLADLSSGAVHWFEDTYLDKKTNIYILAWIAKDNEIHHINPRKMVFTPWYILIRVTFIISIITVSMIYIMNPIAFKANIYLYITWAAMGTFANIIHKWSHMYKFELHYVLQQLQKYKIICDHSHHSYHHFIDSTKRYAVIFPVTNIILDNIKIFRLLESILYLLFNIQPRPKPIYKNYHGLKE